MINLIKLTENDKRLLIVLLLVVILAFVIVGYVYLFVKKIMDSQAKKADSMMYNVVKANYFPNEKKLWAFGIRKNWRVFFRQARIPFIILAASWFLLLGYCVLFPGGPKWSVDLWGYEKGSTGFRTILFVFDWKNIPTTKVFFLKLVSDWPPLLNRPHFEIKAWISYLFIPANIVGWGWLLITVQAYIARALRIRKIVKNTFKKTLPEEAPSNQIVSND